MAQKAGVTFFYDMPKYAVALADEVRHLAAVKIRNEARANVRIDTHRLQNSIRIDQVGDTREVSANTPYCLVQEYGHPLYPNYGFTPYMRPAFDETVRQLKEIVKQASDDALGRAKR